MKPEIHPQSHLVTAVCSCGNTFQVHSTQEELRLEVCNECHPYFTGKQKLLDPPAASSGSSAATA